LKFLHIVVVCGAISVLIGQLITFHVMERFKLTNQRALDYLSLLDHAIPISLVLIGIFGHAMASTMGPVWSVPWVHDSALGLVIYTFFGLVTTLIFRHKRFYRPGGVTSPLGVYAASGVGVAFLLVMMWIMVVKSVPLPAAHFFTPLAKALSGSP
jgi:hypothetical protein